MLVELYCKKTIINSIFMTTAAKCGELILYAGVQNQMTNIQIFIEDTSAPVLIV